MTRANTFFDSANLPVIRAAFWREWLSHRLNRFLYAHIVLVLVAGALPLLTPGDALARGSAWWLLHVVLYAVSLSAMLLGLSSAHAEADEFVWLMGQPAGIGPWLAGKAAGMVVLVTASTALLGLPAALAGGASAELALASAGSVGIGIVFALTGLSVGFWIRDSVRGLIVSVAIWLVLLFGLDFLLLAVAGAPVVQTYPDVWVLPLMLNPLDAYRITILFAVERAAFGDLNAGNLAGWWALHVRGWLLGLIVAWSSVMAGVAWLGARRRLDD